MWEQITPFIWYIAGSLCFLIGSVISLVNIIVSHAR